MFLVFYCDRCISLMGWVFFFITLHSLFFHVKCVIILHIVIRTCLSNTGSYVAHLKITKCVFGNNFLTLFLCRMYISIPWMPHGDHLVNILANNPDNMSWMPPGTFILELFYYRKEINMSFWKVTDKILTETVNF